MSLQTPDKIWILQRKLYRKAKAVAMKVETTRRPLLPAGASALSEK